MFLSYEDGQKSSWDDYKNFSPPSDTNKRKLELIENFMMADTLKTFYDKQKIKMFCMLTNKYEYKTKLENVNLKRFPF